MKAEHMSFVKGIYSLIKTDTFRWDEVKAVIPFQTLSSLRYNGWIKREGHRDSKGRTAWKLTEEAISRAL